MDNRWCPKCKFFDPAPGASCKKCGNAFELQSPVSNLGPWGLLVFCLFIVGCVFLVKQSGILDESPKAPPLTTEQIKQRDAAVNAELEQYKCAHLHRKAIGEMSADDLDSIAVCRREGLW